VTIIPVDLASIKVAYAAKIESDVDGIVLIDEGSLHWHLVYTHDQRFADADLDIVIEATAMAGATKNLYFNQWGGIDLASIAPDGAVAPAAADSVNVSRKGDRLTIRIAYRSFCRSIVFGTSSNGTGGGFYHGTGRAQWRIHSLTVTVREDVAKGAERIVLVDVGAAGGIDQVWAPHLAKMHCVFIEPDPVGAARLENTLFSLPSAEVMQVGLAGYNSVRTLNVTAFDHCSSLLEPDAEALQRFAVAPLFEVVDRVPVSCRRYDCIEGAAVPDFIKVDVQGAEFEVLQGFGGYLDRVLGIELESHLYPIYKGQKLLADLITLMDQHGLRLRNLVPQFTFDRDYLEVNAYFTRDTAIDSVQARKLELIHNIYNLAHHGHGAGLVRSIVGGRTP